MKSIHLALATDFLIGSIEILALGLKIFIIQY